jgi:hypothetical protein
MAAEFDTLSECTYEGLVFPVSECPVEGGNDFAEHTAYRRAGADMEPTGWRAWSGSLTIPLINTAILVKRYGVLWPDLRTALVDAFRETPRGALSHPLLGNLTVAITDVQQSGSVDVRNGVTLTVRWKEHNASVSLAIGADGVITTDPTTTVNTRAELADAAGVSLTGYVAVAATISAEATFLEEAPRTYSDVLGAFGRMDAVVAANIALPSVQALDGYACNVALLDLRAALLSYRARFVPGDASLRYYVVPTTMSIAQIALATYGSLDGLPLVLASNTFVDPLNIMSGTVITILPPT